MKTIFLTLVSAIFSMSAWAHTPGASTTSHPTSTHNPAAVEDSGLSGSATWDESSAYSEDRSSLSGSSTGWTDRNEVPAAESEKLSGGSSLSGSGTAVPFGNSMRIGSAAPDPE